MKEIITIKGDKQPRRYCRCIADNYYLIERDCQYFRGQWYRTFTAKEKEKFKKLKR